MANFMPGESGGMPTGILGQPTGGLLGGNPWLNIGLGILANNTGNYGAFGPAFGRGAQQGINQTQQALHLAQIRQLTELQLQKAALEAEQEKRRKEALKSMWTPASSIANMPFKEANDQVMAGQTPDYQINETPAGFDFNKGMPDLIDADPEMALKYQTLMAKQNEPIKAGAGDVFLDPKTMKTLYSVPQQPKIGDISPDKFTPESIAAFSQSGDYKALVPSNREGKKTQIEMMLDAAGITDPRQRSKLMMQAINKEVSFAPPIQVLNYPQPMPAIGPDNKPQLVQFPNKPGEVPRPTGYSPLPPEAKAPTEQEAKAAFYVQNMRAASQVLDNLEASGFDPTNIGSQVGTSLAGGVTNPIAGKMEQQARQAQNQWAEQMLRMQTGAAATTDEIRRTIATYFPSPGDSPEVVAQKRAMREQAETGVLAASGRASGRVGATPKANKPRTKADILKQYGVKGK